MASRGLVLDRLDFVRKCIAAGIVHDRDIVRACQKNSSGMFATVRSGVASTMSGLIIKRDYIYKVRKQLRETTFNWQEEVAAGVYRLMDAYRHAATEGDVKGMVASQCAVNKMLGLRAQESGPALTTDELRNQLEEIEASIGGD